MAHETVPSNFLQAHFPMQLAVAVLRVNPKALGLLINYFTVSLVGPNLPVPFRATENLSFCLDLPMPSSLYTPAHRPYFILRPFPALLALLILIYPWPILLYRSLEQREHSIDNVLLQSHAVHRSRLVRKASRSTSKTSVNLMERIILPANPVKSWNSPRERNAVKSWRDLPLDTWPHPKLIRIYE